jgi:hypothetical protein
MIPLKKEGNMSKGQITRREAMSHVTKIVAMAAGLSASELSELLSAQIPPPPSGTTTSPVLLQQSASDAIKRLKSILENTRTVFESQYGRVTPVQKLSVDQLLPKVGSILPKDTIQRQKYLDQMAGMGSCMVQFLSGAGGSGALGDSVCLEKNSCTGEESGGCAHGNECNGQSCPIIFNCAGNNCEGQNACSCPGQDKVCLGNNNSIISIDELTASRTDPYIGLLFTRYRVSTVKDLYVQINRVLSQRRLQMVR